MDATIIESPFGNYYGVFQVKKDESGLCFACVENYDECYWMEISVEFYDACVKEFGPVNNIVYFLINSNAPAKAYGPFADHDAAWHHLFGCLPNDKEKQARISLGWYIAECDTAKK